MKKEVITKIQKIAFILVVLAGFNFANTQAQTTPRQAGAADLDAWSRQAIGLPGGFTNPDTRDWIPYVPQKSDVDAGGLLDVSHYIEKPGGTHGFLRHDDKGNFVFEDGTNIRFLGGQINSFPEKAEAEWIVKWMRRYGLNYARTHGFGLPSPERWDRMDYLISQAKKEGIYLVLTPVYWTEFDLVAPDGSTVRTSTHVILFFNKNAEDAVRNLWKEFYTHENPYTGLRYCDDPTLAGFELKNEDSPFWALSWIRRDLPVYWREIQQQFSDYLKDKYKTTEALRKAWTLQGYPSALDENESIEQGNIEVQEFGGWHIERNDKDISLRPRKSDQTEFLHKKLTDFYDRSYKYLREIGCKQAICGSNWRGHSYTMRHVLEADARMDFTDQHDYFDHPQGGWRVEDAVFHNQSMFKSAYGGLIGNLAPRQVINRPYTVSEWNIGAWNEHLMEASFSMVSIGLLHGWDGLIQFVLLPNRSPRDNPTLANGFFNIGENPSVVLQYPTLARLWYRKDIQESEPVFIRRISPEQINMPSPIPSKLMPEVFFLTQGNETPRDDQYGYMLNVVGKIANEFVPTTTPHYEKEGIRPYLDEQGKVARSITGQITWDWGQGYMLINTPKTQAICGYIGETRIEADNVLFEPTTNYGMVMLTTLDDNSDIDKSGRLLLTALGRARNTGTTYGLASDRDKTTDRHASSVSLPPEHRVAVLELGEAPIISEPVKGKVSIKLNKPKNVQAFVLDDLGNRVDEIKTEIISGRLEIKLPGDFKSRFVEIVVERKQMSMYYWLIPVLLLGVILLFFFRKKKIAAVVVLCFYFIDAQAQTTQRQAGAADLAAWSREAFGLPGGFTNPDTRDWIPFAPRKSDVDAGGILDVSNYVEKPSGAHGFLRHDNNGSFVFEDGTNIRFLGGQINTYPEKEEAEWIVKWMRRHGLNYARTHGFGLPRAERWDRLDYLIYQAKKEGVYLVLTPVYWTEFDIVAPDGTNVRTSTHVLLFFNKNAEEAIKNLWKEFYTHENPYTGLRYCDDPTLVGFELKNEDSPFWALEWVKRDLPVFWKEMLQQYADFLKGKYKTTEALRKAWTTDGHPSALAENESLEQENIDLLNMWGWHIERNDRDIGLRPRKSDQTEFLHQKLYEYYDRSYKYLREIGCKQAICGSNWRGYSYTMRHVLEADARMDFTDQHDYFDHPQGGWNVTDAVFHNQSMFKSPQAGLIGNLAPRQVINRPYTVSEWNIGAWNEHLMEASFSMTSIGLLHGWDGLIQFVLLPRSSPKANPTLGGDFFNIGENPSVVLQYPTLARLWHRKDIRESEPVFIRRISPEQINMPSAIPSKVMPEVFFITENNDMPREDQYGHMINVVGKVANEFVPTTTPHFEKEGILNYLDQEGKIAKSMTGQLTWDWGQGYMLINTPMTQGVCGYIGGITIEAKNVRLEATTNYGLVMLTTLDDKSDIEKSERLLLTALGRARNTGTKYGLASDRDKTTDRHATSVSLSPEHRVAVLELGEAPIITEPIKGKVIIKSDRPANAKVFVLDDLGNRVSEIKPVIKAGTLELALPGDHKSRFYEIIF